MAKTGSPVTSLVFPRNQFNEEYLKACWNAGIRVIRSNPPVWYWKGIGNDETSFLRKLVRTGDVYFPLGKRMSYSLKNVRQFPGEPMQLPASRLLRQYDPRYAILNKLRLHRILNEMKLAAENNECYHLWWHPENFGNHPEACLSELQEILIHYKKLNAGYGMISLPMGRYPEYMKA